MSALLLVGTFLLNPGKYEYSVALEHIFPQLLNCSISLIVKFHRQNKIFFLRSRNQSAGIFHPWEDKVDPWADLPHITLALCLLNWNFIDCLWSLNLKIYCNTKNYPHWFPSLTLWVIQCSQISVLKMPLQGSAVKMKQSLTTKHCRNPVSPLILEVDHIWGNFPDL